MALAATNASTAADAFNLLAASSAVANMKVQRASSNAAYAVTESGLATEGLRNSDSTYEKRFKSYDEELQRLKTRVIFLEGFLGRVLSMMQNGNIDSAEVRTPCNPGNLPQFLLTFFLARLHRCSEALVFDEFFRHLL